MVKIQVNSQGKAYLTTGGKALVASGGGDTISAINNTGASVSSGDKVFIAPLATPQSGANYELVKAEIYTDDMYGFLTYSPTSLTINNTDKSISGFYGGYCIINKIMDYSEPWEFNICFQTGYSVYDEQYIFTGGDSIYGSSGLTIFLYQNLIYTVLSNPVDNINIKTFSSYTVSTNTTYYLKIGWTGSQYYVKYSTDGTTWTDDTASPYSSNSIVKQNSSTVNIGYRSGYYFYGKIYMDKTYMTSGDSIQWLMYSDGASNLGSDILTGIASANIASGAVGNVSTILGE